MPEAIFELLTDALWDSVKTLPFLLGAYLLIEFLEHRSKGGLPKFLSKSGPWGPALGAVLGCVPQCGFSVAAANFFAGRLISFGTLLAVFLATSDEALLILLSNPQALPSVLLLLGCKIVVACGAGLLADLVLTRFLKQNTHPPFEDLCQRCDCGHRGIFRSALSHTLRLFFFILLTNVVLNGVLFFVGEETLSRLLLGGSFFQPMLAALLGFIPNCASSILLTELYLSGSLSFGAALSGLCTAAGVGLVVLFKANKNLKQNLSILLVLYVTAVVAGTAAQFLFG